MVRKEKLKAGYTRFPTECFRSPHAPALGTRKALVLQIRSGRGSDTVTESYLLKRQVHLLRIQLERVAYKGQARGPWREVLWTPPFEEISKEEKSDSPQEDSARTESCPEGRCQGAQGLQHYCDVWFRFCEDLCVLCAQPGSQIPPHPTVSPRPSLLPPLLFLSPSAQLSPTPGSLWHRVHLTPPCLSLGPVSSSPRPTFPPPESVLLWAGAQPICYPLDVRHGIPWRTYLDLRKG